MKRQRKLASRNDPERRGKIEAAVRYAEQVARSSNVNGPVLYRPNASRVPEIRPASKRAVSGAAPEGAIATALRSALGRPEKSVTPGPIHAPDAKNRKESDCNLSKAITTGTNKANAPKKVARKLRRAKQPKPVVQKSKAVSSKKRKIVKKRTSLPCVSVVITREDPSAADKRIKTERNAASRLAANARMRASIGNEAGPALSPFVELRRKWEQAFLYLQRFGELEPDAPDIVAARERLALIEAEWENRATLSPDHPDYFPWPSTEIAVGERSLGSVVWEEIGMLKYLGYEVDAASNLTEYHRTRLLGCVFSMRLPTINSVTYMRSWGAPNTAARLRKMADSLASFARGAKRRRNPPLNAIGRWEADLAFLRRTYYLGRFNFPWPNVSAL